MTKRLQITLLSVLATLLCVALVFGGVSLAPKAQAATTSADGKTVTLDALDDFVINSNKRVTNLSESSWTAINNNDQLTEIIIDFPDDVTGTIVSFYNNFSATIKNPIPVTLKLNANMSYVTGRYYAQINVTKVFVESEELVGSEDGSYVAYKEDKTVAWSNGKLPDDANIATSIDYNGVLYGATTVHVPANIESIPSDAFNPAILETISVAADNPAYSDGGGKNCLIDKVNKTLWLSPDGYIPSDGSVTAIENGALRNAAEVTIPAAIETFTNQAFGDALTKLTVASDHPTYIDGGNNCLITKADKKLVFATKATDMATVFNGVEIIGSNAFNGLDVTELVVPETVKQIEAAAFNGLSKLETLSLPFVGREKTVAGGTAGNETRFGYVFPSGSADGDYFSITQRVTTGSGAGTTISAKIPKTLKTVAITGNGIMLLDWSLTGLENTNIENLYLPDDISLANVSVLQDYRSDNTAVTVPLGKYVTENPTDGNYYLYSVTDHTKPVVLVSGNKTATLVNIPEGVTTICQLAFQSAKAVEVVLPSTLKDVQTRAFRWCEDLAVVYNLSKLNIQRGSEDYGGVALYAATVSDEFNGSMITVEGDYTFIATEEPALYRYNGTAEELTLPSSYNGKRYTIADSAFNGNTSIVNVVIPANSALGIGNSAFENCTSLKSIVINDLENSIGKAAFKGCTALNSITFYNCHITEIADEAFMNCSSLLEIAVPETVTSIGKQAFSNCTSAVAITLGNNVEFIGGSAFESTTSLRTASIPDSVKTLGNGSNINVGDGWTRDYLFAGSGIESVYIGSGVKYLGYTFADCKNLKNVTFSKDSSLSDISYAFQGCTALTTLTIPEGVVKAVTAFSGAVSLTSLYIPYSFIEAYNGYSDLFDSSYVYNEYAHLTMYLPEVQGETEEEKAASAKKILTFALYFDNGNYWVHYMNTLVSYTNTQWGGPAEKTEENYTQWLNGATDTYHAYSVFSNVTMILPSKAAYDAVYSILSDADYYKTLGESGRNFNMTVTVKKTDGSGNVTLPLFPEMSQESLLSKFFYVADVTYELYKQMSDGSTKLIDSETVKKLANNEGADIRYVLMTDKYGSKYYAIDESYAMPSLIGATSATGEWKVGSIDGDAFVLDGAKINGANKFVNVLGADAKLEITVDDEYTATYNGEEWTLPASLADKATITSVNGVAGAAITNAGTYTVVITAGEDYEFANGATTATVTVVISKAQAQVVWTYNGKVLNEDEVVTKTFDGKTVASALTLTYVGVNGETLTISNDLITRMLNGESTMANAMGAGLWTLNLSELVLNAQIPNYAFTHTSHQFRINNVQLSSNDVLNGTEIDLEGTATLNDGMLYIYEDNSHNIIPSRTPLTGYTLKEVINVERSIIRYTNRDWTLNAVVLSGSADKLALNADATANNVQKAIGKQTTTFVLNAKDNYEFALSINGGVAERGLTFTVSEDGKTLTITKTWYVVQLANELVKATYTGTDEPSDADLYTVANWTYGQDVTFALPRLWHGDEDANWVNDNSKVKFTLTKQGVTNPIAANLSRGDLLKYLNKYMPAGCYVLTFTVEAFDGTDASYPTFTRRYEFTVAKAAITIDESKLPKNENTGYASYSWELVPNANKELFFKAFADKINADGVLKTVELNAPEMTYWGTEAGKQYFGEYSVKYNFARMNNERYELADNNYLYEFISGGARGTYTVYFQVEMKNHENLTNVGTDGRYAYFFTVTVYETLDPSGIHLDNVVYTGSKALPEVAESSLYRMELKEDDGYVDGGTHALVFVLNDNVHYRWKDVQGDKVEVNYQITKALNEWVEAADIVRWVEGKFNEEENGFIGASKFGSIVYVITDVEDNVIYDISQGIDNRAAMKAGTYILKATVAGTDNYNGLSEAFTIRILEKIGLPWWGTTLIAVGSLAVAAAIILILWKLKVFEILTDKISLAITTRATVDATIAAVRATKKADEADAHKRKVEARERLEAAREANRNKTPEQRAQELQEKAEVTATKADKMHARANKMRERADKLAGKTEQNSDVTDPDDAES